MAEEARMQHAIDHRTTKARRRRPLPQRSRQLRRRRITLAEAALLVALAAAIVATAILSLGPLADASVEKVSTIRVEQTDTLWDIAEDHRIEGRSTAEMVLVIRQLNQMNDSSLVPGQSLKVPAENQSQWACAAPSAP